MSREFLWERLEPRALRPIIRDPPAKSSRLKPLPREPGLPRRRRLQLLQALDRRIQRRFVLCETQPHQALARGRAFVERRPRDRAAALLPRQPTAAIGKAPSAASVCNYG